MSADRVLSSSRRLGGYLPNSSRAIRGAVYVDALGSPTFLVPKEKRCFVGIIKEMIGYKVIAGRAEDNVLVVIGEKKGKYSRFVIIIDEAFTGYTVRVDDVDFPDLNFTKMKDGVAVMLHSDDRVDVFLDNSKAKTVSNPPFDLSMKLFNSMGRICFINGKEIYRIQMV